MGRFDGLEIGQLELMCRGGPKQCKLVEIADYAFTILKASKLFFLGFFVVVCSQVNKEGRGGLHLGWGASSADLDRRVAAGGGRWSSTRGGDGVERWLKGGPWRSVTALVRPPDWLRSAYGWPVR